jgi:hypothetical protein
MLLNISPASSPRTPSFLWCSLFSVFRCLSLFGLLPLSLSLFTACCLSLSLARALCLSLCLSVSLCSKGALFHVCLLSPALLSPSVSPVLSLFLLSLSPSLLPLPPSLFSLSLSLSRALSLSLIHSLSRPPSRAHSPAFIAHSLVPYLRALSLSRTLSLPRS